MGCYIATKSELKYILRIIYFSYQLLGSWPRLASTPAAGRNVKVISSLKNEETLERHLPQLMMRGEHVVVISVMK